MRPSLPRRRQVLALPALLAAMPARAAGPQVVIGGSGPVLRAAALLGEAFSRETGHEVLVLDSLGSLGGLQALQQESVGLALFARPATAQEVAAGMLAHRFADSPLVAATQAGAEPAPLPLARLAAMLDGSQPTWPGGQPLTLVRRLPQEIDNRELAGVSPEMARAVEAMLARTGPRTARTAQQNAEAIARDAGSLGFITEGQARSEQRAIAVVPVLGVPNGPEGGGLVMKQFHVGRMPNANAATQAMFDYMRWSAAGQRLAGLGFRPPAG